MFGLARQKPRHYREMLKIVGENRGGLAFASRAGVSLTASLACLSVWVIQVGPAGAAAPPSADAAFQRFFDARNPSDAAKAARHLVSSGIPFADALARLKRGRTYSADVKGAPSNRVEMKTRGVSDLTLLLSPDVFDFSQPIVVLANGRVVFDGRCDPSVATLTKWAARDNDRTMPFGAELHLSLK